MLLKHGLAGLAQPPAGGNFAGLTKSSSGVWSVLNEATQTITTSAFDVGSADASRVVYAMITPRLQQASVTCTIGGVSATQVSSTSAGRNAPIFIFAATVPTGTTAVIEAVTTAASWQDVVVAAAYALAATEGTPVVNETAADPQTASVTTSAGSSVLMVGNSLNSTSTPTGVNVTVQETADVDISDYMIVGFANSVSAGTVSYGADWGSTPGTANVIAVEILGV